MKDFENETDRAPGDVCKGSDQCHSGICTDGACQALNPEIGATCNVSLDCAASLYCSNTKKCVATKTEGQECQTNEECHFGLDCDQTCKPFFSIQIGSKL